MPTLGEIQAVGKPLDERSDRTGYIWLLGSKVLHPDSPFPIPRPHRKQSYPKLTLPRAANGGKCRPIVGMGEIAIADGGEFWGQGNIAAHPRTAQFSRF